MLRIEIEREEDGRWIGEVPELPGVLAYGSTEAEARNKATALALRVIAAGRQRTRGSTLGKGRAGS
jgi:predicted RNase H-like HicB family nuclease